MKSGQNKIRLPYTPSILRIPYFVLTISIFVTIAISFFYYTSAKKNDFDRFQSETLRVKGEFESHLDTYIALLRAGRSFFYSTDNINKEKFRHFVDNLSLRENYPGVLAIGFSKVFKTEEKEALVKKMQSEGQEDFALTPEILRDEYQAIIYVEPLDERNKKALGFDMSSEIIRKNALDTARDTGKSAITGKVILVQENETEKQNGFLIYFPIYKSNNTPDTVEERKKDIDGFVYSPFRAGDFVEDVIKNSEIDQIAFKIYDNEINEQSYLAAGNQIQNVADDFFKEQNEISIGGRKWIFTYTPTPKFYKQSLTWWTPIIFCLGLAISVVLFFLSFSQSRTNQNLITTAYNLAIIGEKEKEAREAAEKSGKVKDDFLATVSHELRTPLNAISGWMNILQMENVETENREKAISVINKNIRQQVNLIDQMIIFSDLDSFLSKTNTQTFSLNELIHQCLNETIVQISKKNLNLSKELIKENILIKGDREKIRKSISILIENSIKFTYEGGQIKVSLKSQDNQGSLKIVDTGEGIAPELLPNIFNGFQQSDSSSIRKYGGLGLSLAIAKSIIEAHRGTITVTSEGKDQGTTIEVNFPIAK